MNDKRNFKVTCEIWDCHQELIVEVEDSSNIEQEAANALCRKLEQHFKDKNLKEKINEGKISVRQGKKSATLQENGTINEKELMSPKTYRSCQKCQKYLVIFEDESIESHNCSKNNQSSDSPSQNPSGFNWKSPWIIGIGLVLVLGNDWVSALLYK